MLNRFHQGPDLGVVQMGTLLNKEIEQRRKMEDLVERTKTAPPAWTTHPHNVLNGKERLELDQMEHPWIENQGILPVPYGTRIDLIYADGTEIHNDPAGAGDNHQHIVKGSTNYSNGNWRTLKQGGNIRSSIVKWRLHLSK